MFFIFIHHNMNFMKNENKEKNKSWVQRIILNKRN